MGIADTETKILIRSFWTIFNIFFVLFYSMKRCYNSITLIKWKMIPGGLIYRNYCHLIDNFLLSDYLVDFFLKWTISKETIIGDYWSGNCSLLEKTSENYKNINFASYFSQQGHKNSWKCPSRFFFIIRFRLLRVFGNYFQKNSIFPNILIDIVLHLWFRFEIGQKPCKRHSENFAKDQKGRQDLGAIRINILHSKSFSFLLEKLKITWKTQQVQFMKKFFLITIFHRQFIIKILSKL